MVSRGKPATLQLEKAPVQGKENPVPVVEKPANVSSLARAGAPSEKHAVEWIDVRTRNNVSIKGFSGEKPEAGFCGSDADAKARAYCNVHGFWTDRP